MSQETESDKLPPRVYCFGGSIVDLDDICNDFDCQTTRCMWHRDRDNLPLRRGADDNRTEAMTRKSI